MLLLREAFGKAKPYFLDRLIDFILVGYNAVVNHMVWCPSEWFMLRYHRDTTLGPAVSIGWERRGVHNVIDYHGLRGLKMVDRMN